MTLSLYDACVPHYLQILQGLNGVLDKGLATCREKGIDPETLVEARLFDDMFPLRFQVQQAAHHSSGAIGALKSGTFGPGLGGGTQTDGYAALQALVATTLSILQKLTPAEVNARAESDVTFIAGERTMPFTAQGFIQSFSLPNFFFHTATAYGILRMKGVPLGKRDYLAQLRLKQ